MPTALVVSGGGSKGSFAVGAIRYLRDVMGLEFDLVAGTSTGALIAPLVITDELDELQDVYTSVTGGKILKEVEIETAWKHGYLYSTQPLEKLVGSRFTPARVQKILGSPKMGFITTVCIQTAKITYFQTGAQVGRAIENSELIRVTNRSELIAAVVASSNQPVFMPPVWIPPNTQPVRQYVDGGVREYAPIAIAIENGATEIYAIVLGPEPRDRVPRAGAFKGLLPIALRAIGLLTEEVGEGDLALTRLYTAAVNYVAGIRAKAQGLGLTPAQIEALFSAPSPFQDREPVQLHVIRPEKDFDTESLSFDPAEMKKMMAWGWRRAGEYTGVTPDPGGALRLIAASTSEPPAHGAGVAAGSGREQHLPEVLAVLDVGVRV